MDAFVRVIRNPASLSARRALMEEWRSLGNTQAWLIEKQLEAWELPEHGNGSALEKEITRELSNHGREWAGHVASLTHHYRFQRGLVASVTIQGAQFAAIADELFASAPIQFMHIEEPLGDLSEILQSPHLRQLVSLGFASEQVGDDGVRAIAECEHLRDLRLLGIAYCGVSKIGFKHLRDSNVLRGLVRVWMRNNPARMSWAFFGWEGEESFAEKRLGLKLQSKYGSRLLTTFSDPEPEYLDHLYFDPEELAITP